VLEEFGFLAWCKGSFGVGALAAEMEGGLCLGLICDPASFAFYPNFPHLPAGTPVTGIAAYMSGKAPLLGGGCFFNVTAGIGVGGFVMLGQGAGGLLEGSISGELFCLAKAEGSIGLGYAYLAGTPSEPGEDPNYQDGTHFFNGSADAKIRIGRKPFAIEKSKSFDIEYTKTTGQNGTWDITP
jgi:hypothetical protein